jgi:hypothetical protein
MRLFRNFDKVLKQGNSAFIDGPGTDNICVAGFFSPELGKSHRKMGIHLPMQRNVPLSIRGLFNLLNSPSSRAAIEWNDSLAFAVGQLCFRNCCFEPAGMNGNHSTTDQLVIDCFLYLCCQVSLSLMSW